MKVIDVKFYKIVTKSERLHVSRKIIDRERRLRRRIWNDMLRSSRRLITQCLAASESSPTVYNLVTLR